MERIAVVELGLYQAKITIADIGDDFFVCVDKRTEQFRCGFEVGQDHFLKKPQIEEIVRILKNFKKICEVLKVTKTYANAIFPGASKPKNVYSFFDEIFATSGFRLSILGEDESLFAMYSGIINTMDSPKAIAVDLEVDTIGLVEYNRRNILGQGFLSISPTSLIESFPASDFDNNNDRFEAITKKVVSELKKFSWISALDPEFQLIGSGYLFEDIATMVKKLKKYPLSLTHGFVADVKDINEIYSQIKELELDKSKILKGIGNGRADVFCAALCVVLAIAKLTKVDNVTISSYSITEGFIFNLACPSTVEKPISDVLGYSLLAQMKYFDNENAKHNEQIYNLAMLLYKQLKVLHKLPRGYVKILRAAAMLHDCGKRINPAEHAIHSFYTLLNSEVYGLSHREKLLSAYVASLHDGGEISLADWMQKKELVSEEDLAAVKKLGVILRLAEAFDISGTNAIVDINCDVLGDSVIMKTFTEGDNSFEIVEALKGGKDFEKNFKKRLEVL